MTEDQGGEEFIKKASRGLLLFTRSKKDTHARQVEIDTQKVFNNQLFWEGVQEVFEGQDEAYNNMHFADD